MNYMENMMKIVVILRDNLIKKEYTCIYMEFFMNQISNTCVWYDTLHTKYPPQKKY